MSESRLIVYGAGGHGKVVAEAAELAGWKRVVFVDDRWPDISAVGPWPVIGKGDSIGDGLGSDDSVVVAIGDNRLRLGLVRRLLAEGTNVATVVHPNAVVSRYASVGAGSVIFAGAVINVGSRIGLACIVNTGASIDHDCRIADGVHISPGVNLAGGVTIGRKSWVGIGASVRELVTIGDDVTVGAGSVVLKAVADGSIVAGVPAKAIKQAVGTPQC